MARVLLVMPPSTSRANIVRALSRAGHETAAAPSSAVALALHEAEPFHALIAPATGAIDGLGLADRLRAITPGLPIVMLTGLAAIAQRPSGRGSARMLERPFRARDLAALVGEIVAPHPTTEETTS